jgi:YbgC/YbaW family acyl-CoA thioester hydrolase
MRTECSAPLLTAKSMMALVRNPEAVPVFCIFRSFSPFAIYQVLFIIEQDIIRIFYYYCSVKKFLDRCSMKTEFQKLIMNYHLDSFGIVHHGRYLELFEEGRWHYCYENGLIEKFHIRNIYHVVAGLSVKYRVSASFGDKITIETAVEKVTERSITFRQIASKNNKIITSANITNVFLRGKDNKVVNTTELKQFWNDLLL